jgi:hypothetical protein
MQIDIRANEFRNFTEARSELREAMNHHDRRTAYLAMEELRGIEMHSEWPALRERCRAALSEFSVH